MLSLLASGSPRDRIDAACDSPGAHASGAALTRATCLMQLQHCARVRKLCAPHVTALLLHLPAADATMMLPVPTHEALEKVVDSLFGASTQLTGDSFRSWAASHPTTAPLFVPLYRGA